MQFPEPNAPNFPENTHAKAGLVHNRRIFAIAVFASLGGLYASFFVLLIILADCFDSGFMVCNQAGFE